MASGRAFPVELGVGPPDVVGVEGQRVGHPALPGAQVSPAAEVRRQNCGNLLDLNFPSPRVGRLPLLQRLGKQGRVGRGNRHGRFRIPPGKLAEKFLRSRHAVFALRRP
jgi:hypothetical protein